MIGTGGKISWFAVLLTASLWCTTARAHPQVDSGIAKADDADFEGALQAFSQAEGSRDLSLEDLVLLLERRAGVYFAMQSLERMQADLAMLAALRPNHVFGPAIQPGVRQAFEQLRSRPPLQAQVRTTALPDRMRFEVEVHGDPGNLVQGTRLTVRSEGHEWVRSEAGPVERDGHRFEYYAQVLGPGGAVLWSRGTPQKPVKTAHPEHGPMGRAAWTQADTSDEDGGAPLAWWLAGGGAALAVAVVIVGVVAFGNDSDDRTLLSGPTVQP